MINRQDLHILKYCSSFISISEGKVFYITEPTVSFCPLANHFYNKIIGRNDKKNIKESIKRIIELKIKEYGFFTERRSFDIVRSQVPYGASEMLMAGLGKKVIDAAVVVCDGAGTVISDLGKIVQGIGARMHNIIMTSPISHVMKKLNSFGCSVLSDSALIDQFLGVQKAAKMGYKKIGVTIDGQSAQNLSVLKNLERKYGINIISMVICTTGLRKESIENIKNYADFIWSCLSEDVREIIQPSAKMQLSKLMPVYVMSDKGVNFISEIYPAREIILRPELALK